MCFKNADSSDTWINLSNHKGMSSFYQLSSTCLYNWGRGDMIIFLCALLKFQKTSKWWQHYWYETCTFYIYRSINCWFWFSLFMCVKLMFVAFRFNYWQILTSGKHLSFWNWLKKTMLVDIKNYLHKLTCFFWNLWY